MIQTCMPNCIINMFVLGCVVLGPKSQVMLIKPGVSCNNFTHPMPGTFHMLPWAAGGKYKVTTTQYKISQKQICWADLSIFKTHCV